MGVSRRNSMTVVVALLAAMVLALPVFARPDKVDLVISHPCLVGSSSIRPGSYRLVIDTNKVSFMHDGKVVAEATGEWKKADKKADSTSISYEENGPVREIHIGGRAAYFAIS